MNFPDKLKELRKEKGLTQEELASKIFVSRSLIARYDNGSTIPSKENLEKLALIFNVNVSDFFDEKAVIDLPINQRNTNLIIDKFFFWLTITIHSLFILVSFLPIFKMNKYIYDGNPVPNLKTEFYSFIQLTLSNGNPIVIITIIICLIDISISGICISKHDFKNRIWVKVINHILFVAILFLIFFSIMFSVSYLSNKVY